MIDSTMYVCPSCGNVTDDPIQERNFYANYDGCGTQLCCPLCGGIDLIEGETCPVCFGFREKDESMCDDCMDALREKAAKFYASLRTEEREQLSAWTDGYDLCEWFEENARRFRT